MDRIFISIPGSEKYFPEEKVVITGNPVRQELLQIENKKQKQTDKKNKFFKITVDDIKKYSLLGLFTVLLNVTIVSSNELSIEAVTGTSFIIALLLVIMYKDFARYKPEIRKEFKMLFLIGILLGIKHLFQFAKGIVNQVAAFVAGDDKGVFLLAKKVGDFFDGYRLDLFATTDQKALLVVRLILLKGFFEDIEVQGSLL